MGQPAVRISLILLAALLVAVEAIIAQTPPVQLQKSRRETIIGKSDGNGGCRITSRGVLLPDSPPVYKRQVGPVRFRGEECEMDVEVTEVDMETYRRLLKNPPGSSVKKATAIIPAEPQAKSSASSPRANSSASKKKVNPGESKTESGESASPGSRPLGRKKRAPKNSKG